MVKVSFLECPQPDTAQPVLSLFLMAPFPRHLACKFAEHMLATMQLQMLGTLNSEGVARAYQRTQCIGIIGHA